MIEDSTKMVKKVEIRSMSASSRMTGPREPIKNKKLEPIERCDVPTGTQVSVSRFVDQLNNVGKDLKRKSRLDVQNYEDEGATRIEKKLPRFKGTHK